MDDVIWLEKKDREKDGKTQKKDKGINEYKGLRWTRRYLLEHCCEWGSLENGQEVVSTTTSQDHRVPLLQLGSQPSHT